MSTPPETAPGPAPAPDSTDSPDSRPAALQVPLTRREREIATLVSKGLSNAEIARHLFISPRTVDSHLEHAFTKTGASNRVQLADWLREGLLPGPRTRPAGRPAPAGPAPMTAADHLQAAEDMLCRGQLARARTHAACSAAASLNIIASALTGPADGGGPADGETPGDGTAPGYDTIRARLAAIAGEHHDRLPPGELHAVTLVTGMLTRLAAPAAQQLKEHEA